MPDAQILPCYWSPSSQRRNPFILSVVTRYRPVTAKSFSSVACRKFRRPASGLTTRDARRWRGSSRRERHGPGSSIGQAVTTSAKSSGRVGAGVGLGVGMSVASDFVPPWVETGGFPAESEACSHPPRVLPPRCTEVHRGELPCEDSRRPQSAEFGWFIGQPERSLPTFVVRGRRAIRASVDVRRCNSKSSPGSWAGLYTSAAISGSRAASCFIVSAWV